MFDAMTFDGSGMQIYADDAIVPLSGEIAPSMAQSAQIIELDTFNADERFSGVDGSGQAVVIIDGGIAKLHSCFGPDSDSNGIADRIVYQYDFSGNNDADASDVAGHGTHVSSIIASEDMSIPGVAPGVDIIHLKVFSDNGSCYDTDIEETIMGRAVGRDL